jgi:hypothetical protein
MAKPFDPVAALRALGPFSLDSIEREDGAFTLSRWASKIGKSPDDALFFARDSYRWLRLSSNASGLTASAYLTNDPND